jgi:predicted SnoaL-like aldol condensation-catalyzing enzyme
VADAETNKQTVIAYYTLAFNDKQPEEAVARYVGDKYIQHNPQAPDGPRRSSSSSGRFPRRASRSNALSLRATSS